MRNHLFSAAAFMAFALASNVGSAKDPSAKKLKKSPARIAVAGATLKLEAQLWLDPASEATPLAGALALKTGGESFPAGLEVDRVWLIKRKEVWSPAEVDASVAMTEPGQPRTTMNIRFSGGPQWKAGTKIICVVRIKLLDGREGMLKAGKTAVAASPPAG